MTFEPRPSVVRATVVAGGVTTEYLCAGSGRPLLILAAESRREALMEAVPAGFRALAPVGDDAIGAIDAHGLLELLDGLGVWDVHVVADAEFATLATSCTEFFPDRFVGVVIADSEAIDLTGVLASLGP